MNNSIKPLTPIITTTGSGKIIKRYNAKYVKPCSSDNKNMNIGVTPQGSFYYREIRPDKSWSSLYLKKYDGTEVVVDSVKVNSEKKTNVIIQKAGKVIDGKFVHTFNNKFNSITPNTYIGYPAKAYVGNDAFIALHKLKDRVDVSDLKPIKKNFFKRLKNHLNIKKLFK